MTEKCPKLKVMTDKSIQTYAYYRLDVVVFFYSHITDEFETRLNLNACKTQNKTNDSVVTYD